MTNHVMTVETYCGNLGILNGDHYDFDEDSLTLFSAVMFFFNITNYILRLTPEVDG